jgi:hypothetical protein
MCPVGDWGCIPDREVNRIRRAWALVGKTESRVLRVLEMVNGEG